jgi:hypothetical protein
MAARKPWEEYANDQAGFAAGDPALFSNGGDAGTSMHAEVAPIGDPAAPWQDYAQPAPQPAEPHGVVQFNDEPGAVASRLAPEDEARVTQLLRAGDVDGASALAHSRGFAIPNVEDIRQGIAKGRTIGDGGQYLLPKAEDQGAGAAFQNGVSQGASLGTSDEIHGFLEGVGALVQGNSYTDAYNRTVDQDRAQLGADRENHAIASGVGELVGGAVLPLGLEKSGLTATMDAVALSAGKAALREGVPMAEARLIAARAVRKRLATEGAAYGAAYGAGSAEGGPGERLLGATQGAAAGAIGGFVAGQAGRLLSRGAERAAQASPQREMLAAADRIGIGDAVLPADVGGPVTRSATAVAAQTPLGALPIVRAADNLNARGAAVLQSKASAIGDVAADVEGLGTAAIEGAQKYVSSAKRLGGRLYDVAVEKAGNVAVDLQSARDTLDQQIARLKAVPGGGTGLEEAQALRLEMDKPFSVQGVRDWRTENFIDPKFRNTPVEGRMKAVVNAASRDVESALRASGRNDAADAYAAADDHWRGMLANIKRNIEPIVGPLGKLKSAEGVAGALNSAAKNNGARLGSFVHSLPDEQRKIVGATILSPLGRDKHGAFTISQFASDWDKLSPIAKRQTFDGETRAALDDLAIVGIQAKRAMAYGNHSNTGRAVIGDKVAGSLATGSSLALGVKTLGLALAGQYGVGRLLASPRFARWLARAPRNNSPAYVARLSRIARAEPAIATDVLALQQRLVDMTSDMVTRVAAQEGGNHPEVVEGQQPQKQTPTYGAQP